MNSVLRDDIPDIAKKQTPLSLPLDQVGMSEVFVPIQLLPQPHSNPITLNARAEISINLTQKNTRGIHMSRLYLIAGETLPQKPLSEEVLQKILQRFLDSQEGLGSAAYLKLAFELPREQKSLLTHITGWKGYPIRIHCSLKHPHEWNMTVDVRVDYSSTCPCSSALAKGHIKQLFEDQHKGQDTLSVTEMAQWLDHHALAATPHGQRSHAWISLNFHHNATDWHGIISTIEEALTTPTQTAVKRQDEQRFAVLSGQNPMFAEDAARRVAHALQKLSHVASFRLKVTHFESLHSHDAFAVASGGAPKSTAE